MGHRRGFGTLAERLSAIGTDAQATQSGEWILQFGAKERAGCDIGLPLPGCSLVNWQQYRGQIAQVGEHKIGNRMIVGQRPIVAIDPDCPDSGVARAGDIAIKTVAYHYSFVGGDLQPLQHQLKNPEVGFSESMIA